MKKIYSLIIILSVGALFPLKADCLMTSTNYTIYADSIDAGGILSTSGTYSLQDTLSESPIGTITGGSYELRGGYQAMDNSTISLSLDGSTIALGDLSTSQVKSGNIIATITTNSESGYTLSISGVSGTVVNAVSDGTVSAGQEEYGVALTGNNALFANDQSVVNGRQLSSTSSPITNDNTTLTFKASISSGTTSGSRSQTVTLAVSANL